MSDFMVTDEASAAWAVDKILAAQERAARIRANCLEMIAEAEKEAESTAAYLGAMVEMWAKDNLPRGKKSIKLPTGKVQFRTIPGGPRVADSGKVISWAINDGLSSILRVKEVISVDSEGLQAYIASSGDIPPGVEITEARETFSVKG